MGMPKGCKVYRWTEREKEYLKDICFGRSYKEIAMLMTNKFNYEFKASQIKSALQRYNLTTGRTGRFEKVIFPGAKGLKGLRELVMALLKKDIYLRIKNLLALRE